MLKNEALQFVLPRFLQPCTKLTILLYIHRPSCLAAGPGVGTRPGIKASSMLSRRPEIASYKINHAKVIFSSHIPPTGIKITFPACKLLSPIFAFTTTSCLPGIKFRLPAV